MAAPVRTLVSSGNDGVNARREFAVPAASGRFDAIDLSFLDPADEDDRAFLIRAERPEFALAIERGDEEIESDGQLMSPGLHLAIHEIVATQLWQDDPPEPGRLPAGFLTQATGATRFFTCSVLRWRPPSGRHSKEKALAPRMPTGVRLPSYPPRGSGNATPPRSSFGRRPHVRVAERTDECGRQVTHRSNGFGLSRRLAFRSAAAPHRWRRLF